jgi:hypothetical protein
VNVTWPVAGDWNPDSVAVSLIALGGTAGVVACDAMSGDAMFTVEISPVSPHSLGAAPLFSSPEYAASQK